MQNLVSRVFFTCTKILFSAALGMLVTLQHPMLIDLVAARKLIFLIKSYRNRQDYGLRFV